MLNNGKGGIQNLSLDDKSQLNFSHYKATLSNLRQAYVLRGISWFLFFNAKQPNLLIYKSKGRKEEFQAKWNSKQADCTSALSEIIY